MKCLVCHGQDVELERVEEHIQVGEDLVRVPIETLVCQTCGERYYDRQMMSYLERVERQVKAGEGRLREVGRLMRSAGKRSKHGGCKTP